MRPGLLAAARALREAGLVCPSRAAVALAGAAGRCAGRPRRCHGNRNARRRHLLVPGGSGGARRFAGEQGMLVRTFPTAPRWVRVLGCAYVLVQKEKATEIRRSVPPFVETVPECNRVEVLLSCAEQMATARTPPQTHPNRREAGENEGLRSSEDFPSLLMVNHFIISKIE